MGTYNIMTLFIYKTLMVGLSRITDDIKEHNADQWGDIRYLESNISRKNGYEVTERTKSHVSIEGLEQGRFY